jgi:hypothetical protein
MLPQGKGFFTWKLVTTEGGDMAAIAAQAEQAGFGHVLVKIADGIYSYNVTAEGVDLAAELVRQAHDRIIQAFGWAYVYLDDPIKEADKVIQRIRETGVDGLYIDGEGECKGKYDAARTFMGRLRSVYPTLPVLLCSYRFPSYHPTFPWDEFLSGCDAHAPQVYWVGAHNPVEQLIRSFNELMGLRALPIVPVFSAYESGTWAPTVDDIARVLTYSKDTGFAGCNFWEWAHTKAKLPQLWVTIANFKWAQPEPEPEPEPQPDKLDILIAGMAALDQKIEYVSSNTDAILDLVRGEMPPPDDGGEEPPPGDGGDEPAGVDFRITEDPRCNARFYEVWNETKKRLEPHVDGAGKPIWMVYPSDASKASERVQFTKDTIVKVILPAETGTGGVKCVRLVSGVDDNGKTWTKGAHGEKLYVPQASGQKV